MQCNQCGSDHTQRLQVAYEGGTQAISTHSHTGDMLDLSDSLRLTGYATTTSGVSRSLLAQRAAPPEKRKLMTLFVITVIGLLFLRSDGGFFSLGLFMAGGGGHGLYTAIRFNREQWPALYQHWSNSWMCHKCGNVYQQ